MSKKTTHHEDEMTAKKTTSEKLRLKIASLCSSAKKSDPIKIPTISTQYHHKHRRSKLISL
jgi:hypothetical protein